MILEKSPPTEESRSRHEFGSAPCPGFSAATNKLRPWALVWYDHIRDSSAIPAAFVSANIHLPSRKGSGLHRSFSDFPHDLRESPPRRLGRWGGVLQNLVQRGNLPRAV